MNTVRKTGDHRGLTLIELVAALVLLSVLLTALTGLLPRFAARAADRQAALQLHDLHWTRVAIERLADDLMNAEVAEIDGRQLKLTGRLERDPVSRLMTDTEGACSYRMISQPGRTLLVREQNGVRTLLGAGRITLTIQSLQRDGKVSTPVILSGLPSGPEQTQPLELAPRMRIALLDDTGQPLASTDLIRAAFVESESIVAE